MRIYNDITETIGNTPIVRINKITKDYKATILAKLESFNPLSSVKDRIALAMLEAAEKEGKLNPSSKIVEPTSGNTGIGLAFVCAVKGYDLTLTMPETMSVERRKILEKLGAKIILTDGAKGMNGAVEEANLIAEKDLNVFIPQQFKNKANYLIHEKTTAEEIWADTEGKIDAVVVGVGTGGTITGIGHALKKKNPEIKIIAIEPESSPMLSKGKKGAHRIQGIGAGFIPDVLDTKIIDEIITVSDEAAIKFSSRLAKEEGILAGFSSGASLCGALTLASKENYENKTILCLFPDTGERYLSL